MTSLSRKLRRANARKNGIDWIPKARPYRLEKRGNAYSFLRPTKGWKRISDKRLRAQARLRGMAEFVAARRGLA